ncbi:hypothetical protein E4U52_008390 [Claviceps spartinae]|nr:hypothetical protein E4U52_008390 [Claviceps spartinae]
MATASSGRQTTRPVAQTLHYGMNSCGKPGGSASSSVQAPASRVVIIDYEKALRKALDDVFPYTQQQLCVYHINTNVRSRIRSQWNKGKKNKIERLPKWKLRNKLRKTGPFCLEN